MAKSIKNNITFKPIAMRKFICGKCANIPNGRLKIVDGDKYIDGELVAQVCASPSQKRKCVECGNKVKHFFTNKHFSIEAQP